MRICRTYSDLCSCNFIYDKLNSIEVIVKVYVILDHPSYVQILGEWHIRDESRVPPGHLNLLCVAKIVFW